jgi:hypothetical protein
MPVRFRTPVQNLASVDLRRESRVRLDKILSPGCDISITTICPLVDGTFGVIYGPITLTEKDGRGPFTWDLVGGSLPSGVTLSAMGVISGTPTP